MLKGHHGVILRIDLGIFSEFSIQNSAFARDVRGTGQLRSFQNRVKIADIKMMSGYTQLLRGISDGGIPWPRKQKKRLKHPRRRKKALRRKSPQPQRGVAESA